MLRQLAIRDLVLIERLELDLAPGLTVLTGETGAGKSILLDGLDLALGGRADSGLVRKGAPQADIVASFAVAPQHPALALLAEQAIEPDADQIHLRRLLRADGGSRAWVNDTPVSAGLLRQLGQLLVEIHGQHAERGLLAPRGHLALLDNFAGHDELLQHCAAAFARWQQAQGTRQEAEAQAARAAAERDWLEHATAELQALNPEPGEEAVLAGRRAAIQKGARLAERLQQVGELVSGSSGALSQLRQAARRLQQIAAEDTGLQQALDAIDRALVAGDDMEAALADTHARLDISPAELEQAESRLFELRALARKHRVEVDALAALAAELGARLADADAAGDRRRELAAAEAGALQAATAAAAALHQSRAAAAGRLAQAVNAELPALRLDSARFRVRIDATELHAHGHDQVAFEIATNNATDFGALAAIASGGELSRFILALKVVLARAGTSETLIFDEIDRGVGGATASAIGSRLARVAASAQVLVVTHSPQVAAAAAQQFHIAKADGRTDVRLLDRPGREQEIARMLSGAKITPEARAQAERLLAASSDQAAAG